MHKILLLLVVLATSAVAERRAPDGGGKMALQIRDHMSLMQRVGIDAEIKNNRQRLGLITPKGDNPPPQFLWPVQAAVSFNVPGIHGISNFVDQDQQFPGLVQDYACGQRTYDVDNGYNHDGVDIFTWPFSWRQMEADQARVVAAAAGTLLAKVDRHGDRSCGNDFEAPVNFVIVQHDDGSTSEYLHLKQNSATAKALGQRVKAGEYLGVVGSSGFSTGPHLHFEVHSPNSGLIEPYAGQCNALNDTSYWIDQPPYYDSAINRIATHSAAPLFPPCPASAETNLADLFDPGDSVFFTIYLRDELRDQVAQLRVIDPNGNTLDSWQHSMDQLDHFTASYWFWSITLPTDAVLGQWRFEVDYQGQSVIHPFTVGPTLPTPEVPPEGMQIYSGLWFDPSADGDGLNIVNTENGMLLFYFGSNNEGQRLWLISDVLGAGIVSGEPVVLDLFESTGGSFEQPIGSTAGLNRWGQVAIDFEDCSTASVNLAGLDGNKTASMVKLASIRGAGCGDDGSGTNAAAYSGVAYDPALEGEGYNIIVSATGMVVFFYGFDQLGQRIWLVTDTAPEPIVIGSDIELTTYHATSGTFDSPVTSAEALSVWGTMTLNFDSCKSGSIRLDGNDGRKTSQIVQLAGIDGYSCDQAGEP